MKYLKDFSSNYLIKALIYGDSGAGKTCLASTFPGPICFLDFDNKLSSAFNYLGAHDPAQIEKIAYETFSSNRVTENPYKEFQKTLNSLEAAVVANKFNFKTVVLDSLTLYAESMMADVIKSNPNIKRAIPGHPSMTDYGIFGTNFRNDIGRLLSLPCNVICIGHIKEVVDETNGVSNYTVMLAGQAAKYAPKVFREVYRAFVKQEKDGIKRLLQTQPDGKFEVRTEMTGMPAVIPMSYQELVKYQPKAKEQV